MRRHAGVRCVMAMIVTATALVISAVPAMAITPPPPADPRLVPGATTPRSEFDMRRSNKACATAAVMPGSDLGQTPPALVPLNLARAHTISTGKGVSVAVIDTGVARQQRLPNLVGGGDYVGSERGLVDCDSHGTIVAGIIGASPSREDALVGVAPDARIISIRQSSDAYSLQLPSGANAEDPRYTQNAVDIRALARAIAHAARLGAQVINISVTACLSPGSRVDMRSLSSAIWWASHVKDAVIISSAGNTGDRLGCAQNPDVDPAHPEDPRNWAQVNTISVPSYFPDVLSVGFTSPVGEPSPNTLRGPWVRLAAPGVGVVSLGTKGGVVNGVYDQQGLTPLAGSSFAAAYVSGVAALIRSRYPSLNREEVIDRLVGTAHSPARGVDNTVGYGMVDPVAALLNAGQSTPPQREDAAGPRTFAMPPASPEPSRTPQNVALIGSGVLIGIAVLGVGAVASRRSTKRAGGEDQ